MAEWPGEKGSSMQDRTVHEEGREEWVLGCRARGYDAVSRLR